MAWLDHVWLSRAEWIDATQEPRNAGRRAHVFASRMRACNCCSCYDHCSSVASYSTDYCWCSTTTGRSSLPPRAMARPGSCAVPSPRSRGAPWPVHELVALTCCTARSVAGSVAPLCASRAMPIHRASYQLRRDPEGLTS
jgi:hypothetical protein